MSSHQSLSITKTLTVTREHLLSHVVGAQCCGLDLGPLYARAGISEEQLENPHSRYPYDNLSRLRMDICRILDDENAGFLERAAPWGSTVMFCEAITSSRTLREVLTRYQRQTNILAEEVQAEFVEGPYTSSFNFFFENRKQIDDRAEIEARLSFLLSFTLWLSGGRFRASKINLTFPIVSYADDYCYINPVKHVFGHQTNGIEFDTSLLREPVRQPPRALKQFLSNHLSYLIDENLKLGNIVERVKRVISASAGIAPTLETVSGALRMAPTTLRRRLREEGASFQRLKDEIRMAKAIHYLKDKKLTVAETAELTGFADPASFSRAFKEWTGISPRNYGEKSYSVSP